MIARTRHSLAEAKAELEALTRRRRFRRPDQPATDETHACIAAQDGYLRRLEAECARAAGQLHRARRRLDDAERAVARIPDVEAAIARRGEWFLTHRAELAWERRPSHPPRGAGRQIQYAHRRPRPGPCPTRTRSRRPIHRPPHRQPRRSQAPNPIRTRRARRPRYRKARPPATARTRDRWPRPRPVVGERPVVRAVSAARSVGPGAVSTFFTANERVRPIMLQQPRPVASDNRQ